MSAVNILKTMRVPCDYMLAGWIYVLHNSYFDKDIYKVGMTRKTPEERAKELSSTGVPGEFDVVFAYATNSPEEHEAAIHKYLEKYRINNNREFFQCDIKKIRDAANDCELIERYELVENIAVTNDIIALCDEDDYTEMCLHQSEIYCYGNINAIRNYIFEIGLTKIRDEIQGSGKSIVITNRGVFLIRNTVAQMEYENQLRQK